MILFHLFLNIVSLIACTLVGCVLACLVATSGELLIYQPMEDLLGLSRMHFPGKFNANSGDFHFEIFLEFRYWKLHGLEMEVQGEIVGSFSGQQHHQVYSMGKTS